MGGGEKPIFTVILLDTLFMPILQMPLKQYSLLNRLSGRNVVTRSSISACGVLLLLGLPTHVY